MVEIAEVSSIQGEMKRKLEQALRFTANEFAGLRTGRASVGMLEHIEVDRYGARTPLGQMGNISVPEPQLLMVQVYDASAVKAVEKAIATSNLGLSANVEGNVLRVPVPVLTEERRKLLVHRLRKLGEEHKVALRNVRRDANDKMKRLEKDKVISQDVLRTAEKEVQTVLDAGIEKVDQMMKAKEQELLEV